MGCGIVVDNVEKNEYQWKNTFSFLMALIGAVIGLGNIWRFSYVLYSNGGGAFFIPYIVSILIMGVPFMILEYGIGAKYKDSLSNILKKIRPNFEIIGWLISFIIFLVLTYYIVLVGWDLYYFVLSFFKGWTSNPNAFFVENVIVGTNDLSGLTTFVLPTLIATTFIWILTWYISHKSLDEGLSKVVNILMPLLFVMIALIVIYSFTLNGMGLGIKELLNPDWNYLWNINVWLAALGQTVFSLSIGQAIIVTYASYLPENTKLIDNVVLVVIINSVFEIFTALGVFSILGFMVHESGIALNEIATSGTGLLFVVFPEIFNIMGDMAYIIGPLFFLAVFFAGITSILAFIEPLSLGISTKFKLSRQRTNTILCFFGFLLSLIFMTASGNYLLGIVDAFLNDLIVILTIIIQSIIFAWLIDLKTLLPVLNKYSHIKVGKKWIAVTKYVLPIFLSILWVFGIINLLNTESFTVMCIEIVFMLLIVMVPLILTVLPSKED